MNKKQTQTNALVAEIFIEENYQLRRNQLNGKLEYRVSGIANPQQQADASWLPLTREAQNSMVLRAMREDVCDGDSPRQAIDLYLHSDDIPLFNPAQEFLGSLPQWDGQNHVGMLLKRLPGLSTEQTALLSIWMRSMVAHWLEMDTLHGNEVVPTLIGAQGCGKTTFLRRLLPMPLRQYFMDSINLSNRFDKEMALTNNLLVNLDELDAIRPSQHASLKQTLSVSKVNGRPIYGASQDDRPRYASFTATTNNRHPLTDVTGSRRFICISIPEGQFIDNSGEIDHQQLFAQLKYELEELKVPYWFSNEEVARIQEMNLEYMAESDLTAMVLSCFRKPEGDEQPARLSSREVLEVIRRDFPSVASDHSTTIHLGLAMKQMGFPISYTMGQRRYMVVERKAA